MLQTGGDIANLLENVTETPIMTSSVEPKFKRLNAPGARPGHFVLAKI